MKWCIVFLVLALIFSGCASLPIDKLQVGMTKAEVEELFDQKPLSYMRTGTAEAIDYKGHFPPTCTLFFLDGKLREWYCQDNTGVAGSFVGVTVPMPAPPARY